MDKIFCERLLKRNLLVIDEIKTDKENNQTVEVVKLLESFSSLGYTLNVESIKLLISLDEACLKIFYLNNFNMLRKEKGMNVKHTIFYPQFPNMENIRDDEYYGRALLHYITSSDKELGFMNQDLKDFKRIEVNNPNKEVLYIINRDEALKVLEKIVNSLFEQKTAIPANEKNFIFAMGKKHLNLIHPNVVPFKENIPVLINTMYQNDADKGRKMKKMIFYMLILL